MRQFQSAWADEFAGHAVVVVEDNPEPTFDLGSTADHYCWADIERELGDAAWIISRRSANMRCFGFYKAFSLDVDLVVTLDDDCLPSTPNFLSVHADRLATRAVSTAWTSTGSGLAPRGMPYRTANREMECVLNHGLWTGVPDLDAMTQITSERLDETFVPTEQAIPRGTYFPMCAMNLAFTRALIPAMYFPLMGPDWPYDRYGDIWAGILVKRVCDHLGLGVKSGEPFVHHDRASNVWENLRKEATGYEINESLWRAVDQIVLTESSVRGCYVELAQKLPIEGPYWDSLREAMRLWADLFPA
jgi:reversibly glycosylated polypeptide/UDP-arabinopyranose mutase